MAAVRNLVLNHCRLAALVIALALCLKGVVPPGYMIAGGSKTLTVLVCADSEHRRTAMTLVVPTSAQEGGSEQQAADGTGLCPYACLSVPALAAADPLQLALALRFVMARGFAAVPALLFARTERLRPPLRGPPALA